MKHASNGNYHTYTKSHPSRMRGLKPVSDEATMSVAFVASLTDAWIETFMQLLSIRGGGVASLTDAWIETSISSIVCWYVSVASLTDAWIETVHRR